MNTRKLEYNVAPRYTAGSPALVDYQTAMGVAEDERRAYERALSGRYGEPDRVRAQSLGLSGIVEHRTVYAHHYVARDVLTGETRDSRGDRAPKARPAVTLATPDVLAVLVEMYEAASAREAEHVLNRPTVDGLRRFVAACEAAREAIATLGGEA